MMDGNPAKLVKAGSGDEQSLLMLLESGLNLPPLLFMPSMLHVTFT
jgi:hypothetical protein